MYWPLHSQVMVLLADAAGWSLVLMLTQKVEGDTARELQGTSQGPSDVRDLVLELVLVLSSFV